MQVELIKNIFDLSKIKLMKIYKITLNISQSFKNYI